MRFRRLLIVPAGALVLLAVGGSTAQALPGNGTHGKHWWDYVGNVGHLFDDPVAGASPSDTDPGMCKAPPTPQSPGSGFSGWIDSGDPSPSATATSVYGKYGYLPEWHTYDLGCGGAVRDPGTTLDTTLGNWLKGAATVIVAAENSVHRLVSPPNFLSKLDPVVDTATHAMRDAVWAPYLDLSVLVLSCFMLHKARKGDPAGIASMGAWALLVLTVVTQLSDYPTRAGHAVDNAATSVIGGINKNLLGEDPTSDPASARAGLLTERILYQNWLRGEFGSADATVAQKYGALVLGAQAYTYAEAKQIQTDPAGSKSITQKKADNFVKLGQAIRNECPSCYNYFKGQAGGRTGTGAITLFAAVATAPFQILADILIVISLILIRLLVIFAPAIGILAIHPQARKAGIGAVSMAGAAILNSIAAAAIAGVDMVFVGKLLDPAIGLPMWACILLCLVFQYIFWSLLKPFRKLTTMVSPSSLVNSVNMPGTGKLGKAMWKFLGTTGAVFAGEKLAHRGDKDDDAAGEAPETVGPERPESFTRPVMDERQVTGERPAPSDAGLPTADTVYMPQTTPERQALPAPSKEIAPEPFRASETVDQDGTVVYKVWDPATKAPMELPADDKEQTDV